MIFETQEQLDACLAKWQKILRLQDWAVKAKVKRRNDMVVHCNANIKPFKEYRQAVMELIDVLDFEDGFDEELDHEFLVVHELLHLSLGVANDENDEGENPARYLAVEQHINAVAWALVILDRKSGVESAHASSE